MKASSQPPYIPPTSTEVLRQKEASERFARLRLRALIAALSVVGVYILFDVPVVLGAIFDRPLPDYVWYVHWPLRVLGLM